VDTQQIYMSKLHTFLLFCCGLEESPLRGAVSPKPSAANGGQQIGFTVLNFSGYGPTQLISEHTFLCVAKRSVRCPGSPFLPHSLPFSCVFLVQTTHAQPCRTRLCTAQRRSPRKARAQARTLCSACTRCSTTHRPPRMPTTSTKRSTRRTDRRTADDAHKCACVQAFLFPFALCYAHAGPRQP
jgi:hypothetical protein